MMQINRLFEIVYILLNKKTTTAKELAERFEVSTRTIYRDIETLSAAGIPIFTNKGKGGGISLMEGFVLNKSILSEKEQNEVLMSLQSLAAVEYSEIDPLLDKLSTFFKKTSTSWIDIDFSRWNNDSAEREKFDVLKTAIFNGLYVNFEYYSSNGEKTERTAAPVKLVFRGQSWYMYGFCQSKEDYRFFKISRMKCLEKTELKFLKTVEPEFADKEGLKVANKEKIKSGKNVEGQIDISDEWTTDEKKTEFLLRIDGKLAYRVFDEFDEREIERKADGSFLVRAWLPENEWVYGYIMSFGDQIEILEPLKARKRIREKYQAGLSKYI